jgi:hypothetical protein
MICMYIKKAVEGKSDDEIIALLLSIDFYVTKVKVSL